MFRKTVATFLSVLMLLSMLFTVPASAADQPDKTQHATSGYIEAGIAPSEENFIGSVQPLNVYIDGQFVRMFSLTNDTNNNKWIVSVEDVDFEKTSLLEALNYGLGEVAVAEEVNGRIRITSDMTGSSSYVFVDGQAAYSLGFDMYTPFSEGDSGTSLTANNGGTFGTAAVVVSSGAVSVLVDKTPFVVPESTYNNLGELVAAINGIEGFTECAVASVSTSYGALSIESKDLWAESEIRVTGDAATLEAIGFAMNTMERGAGIPIDGDNGYFPAKVETPILAADGTTEAAILVTADKYYLHTPYPDQKELRQFYGELFGLGEGFDGTNVYAKLSLSKSEYTTSYVYTDVWQDQDGNYSIYADNMQDIISNVDEKITLFVSLWKRSPNSINNEPSANDTLLFKPTAVPIQYVPDAASITGRYSLIHVESMTNYIEACLPGCFRDNVENPKVFMQDQTEKVLAQTVGELSEYNNTQIRDGKDIEDDRYEEVFNYSPIRRNCTIVGTTLYRAANFSKGNCDVVLKYADKSNAGKTAEFTCKEMIEIVDGPIVKEIDTWAGRPAVIGEGNAEVGIFAAHAQKDDFSIIVRDENKKQIGSSVSSRYQENNLFVYKIELDNKAAFEENRNYFVEVNCKEGVTAYIAGSDTKPLYPTSAFVVYSVQQNQGSGGVDLTLNAVNPPAGKITVGLFPPDEQLEDPLSGAGLQLPIPLAQAEVAAAENMQVVFDGTSSLQSGQYEVRILEREFWRPVGGFWFNGNQENNGPEHSLVSQPYFYYDGAENSYEFDVLLSKEKYGLQGPQQFTVQLLDGGMTIGALDPATALAVDSSADLNGTGDAVQIRGKINITGSAITSGKICTLAIGAQGKGAIIDFPVSAISKDKVYATYVHPSFGFTEQHTTVSTEMYLLKIEGSYQGTAFSYDMSDLLGNPISVGDPTVSGDDEDWSYEEYKQVDAEITPAAIDAAFYYLSVKYGEKEIYDLNDPSQKIFSKQDAVWSIPPTAAYYGDWVEGKAIYALDIRGNRDDSPVEIEVYSKDELVASETLIKGSLPYQYLIPATLMAKINSEQGYDIALINRGQCIGVLTNAYLCLNAPAVPATGVQLDQDTMSLKIGETKTLAANVLPQEASNKGVSWSSDKSDIAKVDTNGNVTGVKDGSAVITVTSRDGSFTDTCTVTVASNLGTLSFDKLTYDNNTEILPVSDVYAVDGAAFGQNNPLKITLKGTGYDAGTSYNYVVAIGGSEIATGAAIGSALTGGTLSVTFARNPLWQDGDYVLSVIIKDGNSQVAAKVSTLRISGTPVAVTGVSLDRHTLRLTPGGNATLKAVVAPVNATNKNIQWSSDKESVASVNASGQVTGVGAGTATITATTADGSFTDTCAVAVGVGVSGTLKYGSTTAAGIWLGLYQGNNYISGAYTDGNGNFSFANIKTGTYTLQAYSPDSRYNALNQQVVVAEGDTSKNLAAVSFPSKYANTDTLTVNVTKEGGGTLGDAFRLYIYDYQTGVSLWRDYDGTQSSVSIADLPYDANSGSTYYVSLYASGQYNYYFNAQSAALQGSGATLNFEVPVTYKISGTVKEDGSPVSGLSLYAQDNGDSSTLWGYTDSEGKFTIHGAKNGRTYALKLCSDKYGISSTAGAIAIAAADSTGNDITVAKGMSLQGVVSNGSEYPYKAYIQLTDSSDNWITGGYATKDGYFFDGAIKSPGTYKMKITAIYDKNGCWKNFASDPVPLTIGANDFIPGDRKTVDLSYSDPTNASDIFKGTGNMVLSDVGVVREGSKINLVIKYKNNGNSSTTAEFKIDPLPAGMNVAAGQSDSFTVTDLAAGASGQKSIALAVVGNIASNYAKIPVTVKIGDTTYDFGSATVEVANVTLNGPGAVKTTDSFKVYGEATSNSEIKIKDSQTGEILGAAKPNGRWYSAELKPLGAGTHYLVAEAVNGNVTAASPIMEIQSKADQITIEQVSANSADSTDLPINKVIGVRAFTAWVGPDLSGRDISLAVKFAPNDSINSVTYHFAEKDYTATSSNGKWSATLSGWSGAGLKTITATVKTTDNRTLTFIIAEVTILIDPSGYLTDEETGSRVAGATVVCEVLNGGTWEVWDAELYGQVNPQTTDAEGNYGWMVPAGTYRVKALKNGYDAYVTTDDNDFSDGSGNSTIVIPPVRTDVNIALTPAILVTAVTLNKETTSITAGNTETLTAAVTPEDATNAGNVVWTSSNTSIATVSAGGTVTAVAAGSATITAKIGSIQDTCTVTVTATGGGNSGNGGGGVIAPAPTTPVSGKVKSVSADNSGKATVKPADMKDFDSLKVDGAADLVFDKKATDALKGGAADLTISIAKVENNQLSEEAKTVVGDRPVYEFSVLSGSTKISSFGGGSVQVSVPYEPKAGEDQNAIVVYYIDSTGKPVPVSGCVYDPTTKTVTFVTNHFSKYAIGYNKKSFADVPSWATNYVTYLAARGIVSGIGSDQYGSQNNVSRADFVVMLARIAGADLSSYTGSNFSDVAVNAYYRQAVEWAAANGITSGIGGGLFAPKANITRQDMAVMLQKFAAKNSITLSATASQTTFADQNAISSYAATAATAMQQASVISGKQYTGKSGFYFAPKDKATRAETAKMLTVVMKSMVK